MTRRSLLLFLLLGTLIFPGLAGCKKKEDAKTDASPASRTLTVFAAASLKESFEELGKAFEAKHVGVKVMYNFAGSQQLRAQLENGAPADVFASANRKEIDAAVAAKLVAADRVRVFARNRLVVIYPKANPGKIATLADLARPGVKLDLADPAVPVGKYTDQMLEAMSKDPAYGADFKAKVTANVASREENVKSVLTKVRLGEADAGVVYVTDVTEAAAKDVGMLDVQDPFNQTAEYPAAPVATSKQSDLAAQFVDYVLSAEGQAVMKRYGFLPPAKL